MTKEVEVVDQQTPTTVEERTPEVIAQEINAIKRQSVVFLQSATAYLSQQSFEIGKRLTEAKEKVNHGEWGEWLSQNVDYSESTAKNLMRIYREFDPVKNPVFAELSYKQMVDLFALPASEREQFVEENDIKEKTSREIQELIKAKKEAEAKADSLQLGMDALRDEMQVKEDALKKQQEDLKQKQMAAGQAIAERDQLTKDLASAKADVKAEKDRVKDLKKEVEALKKAKPQKEQVTVYEPSPETIEQMRKEILEETRALMEKEAKKQEVKQNANVLEVNLLFKRLQLILADMKTAQDKLQAEDAPLAEKLREKIKKGFAQLADQYFG